MKKLSLAFVLFLLCMHIHAQLRMGVTGYHNSVRVNTHSRDLPTLDGRHAYTFGMTGHENQYSFGVGFFNNYGNLFLMPEILYRKNVATYGLQNLMRGESVANEIKESRTVVQIPVAAGVDFGLIRVGVGPTFELLLDETNTINSLSDIVRKERKVNCGFQFLLGVDLSKNLLINLKYEQEFNKAGDMYYYNNMNTRIQSRVSRISAGIGIYI